LERLPPEQREKFKEEMEKRKAQQGAGSMSGADMEEIMKKMDPKDRERMMEYMNGSQVDPRARYERLSADVKALLAKINEKYSKPSRDPAIVEKISEGQKKLDIKLTIE
jgi:hypothetical protein